MESDESDEGGSEDATAQGETRTARKAAEIQRETSRYVFYIDTSKYQIVNRFGSCRVLFGTTGWVFGHEVMRDLFESIRGGV